MGCESALIGSPGTISRHHLAIAPPAKPLNLLVGGSALLEQMRERVPEQVGVKLSRQASFPHPK